MAPPFTAVRALLILTATCSASPTILSRWEFTSGLDGWGDDGGLPPSDGHAAEAWWRPGGILVARGHPRSAQPLWLSSPSLRAPVGRDAYVVLRARHLSACTAGAVAVSLQPLLVGSAGGGNASWAAATADDAARAPLPQRTEFAVVADGRWHEYAAAVLAAEGAPEDGDGASAAPLLALAHLHLLPCLEVGVPVSLELDWVRLVRAPAVWGVSGCGRLREPERAPLDQWFATSAQARDPERKAASPDAALPLGGTYGCARGGGELLTVRGAHFGPIEGELPVVLVDGELCTGVAWVLPEESITCRTPPAASALLRPPAHSGKGALVNVTVLLPGMARLSGSAPLLVYAAPAAPPPPPRTANLGARALDVLWEPPPDTWQARATTGFLLQWRRSLSGLPPRNASNDSAWAAWPTPAMYAAAGEPPPQLLPLDARGLGDGAARAAAPSGSLLTGNVSTTAVWGLAVGTAYQFRVAALADVPQAADGGAWLARAGALGQRAPLAGATLGLWSAPSQPVWTLPADVLFARFDAQGVAGSGSAAEAWPVDYGGSPSSSLGEPLRWAGGEGAHGLLLVGSASLSNCNATHACCDGYGGSGWEEWVGALGAGDGSAPLEAGASSLAAVEAGWGLQPRDGLRAWLAAVAKGGRATPWFGYDDASDLIVVAPAELLAARAAEAAVAAAAAVSEGVPLASGLLLVTRRTAQGTNYSYTRAIVAPQPPAALWDEEGRKRVASGPAAVAGGAAAATRGDLAASCSSASASCDGLRQAPAAPSWAPPWWAAVAGGAERAPSGLQPRAPPLPPPAPPPSGARSRMRTPTAPCGPALRLTASHPSQTGAAWYARPQHLARGFEAAFGLRLANPSTACRTMEGVATHCRSRGGGGAAFVLQNWHPHALGGGGASGGGYDGLPLSVAVEFDTWSDDQRSDPYENHVSVHAVWPPCEEAALVCASAAARSWAAGEGGSGADPWRNSAHHDASLGHARFVGVPDLAAGVLSVRIVYAPLLDPALVQHPAWVPGRRLPCRGSALGTLSVFLGDAAAPPVLIVPLDLPAALRLDESYGRAWVGFTAATGAAVWQTHDVVGWELTTFTGG